ncbi:hypothetical protein N7474_005474 [Penicillium riverlandense]|uniref:uncharacterized protein n=1 Tax=Penicillium riverlandense TaxID=1903569 RepID=UPI002546C69A|nr:uncharacterized protein N7474_005474 [Penicillium riverlandense]KAJ5819883.1 hypothetical protein N7474_005474 [Penicillium riverlandense]
MATEDDNFDIDIYGDGGGFNANEPDFKGEDSSELVLDAPENPPPENNVKVEQPEIKTEPLQPSAAVNGEHQAQTQQQQQQQQQQPQEPAAPHGVKRKEYDDRSTDPDATAALLISDLFWWTTDDDIRGWVNQAECEDGLKDVTFSEHKVNGKSKGQAFVEFTTPQAATAAKHQIESLGLTGSSGRKHVVIYTNPHANPFKTLPKDAPMRKDNRSVGGGGGFTAGGSQNFGMNNMGGGGGFRGGRGGGYNRGMGGNLGGGFNNRNNFNAMGGGGGFQGGSGPNNMMGGFQGQPMGGGMQNYGFSNRGNMMGGMRGGPGGMRGGRGGNNMGGPNMMGGMPGMNPMGGMGMNPMAGAMGPMMGGMGGNMGMQGQGFQGPNQGFNQGFYNPNQGGGGDASWNPHGAKRSRQE